MIMYLANRKAPKLFSGEDAVARAEKALAKDVESFLREWFTRDYGDEFGRVVEYETCGKDVSYLSKYSGILEEFARFRKVEKCASMEIDDHLRIKDASRNLCVMEDYDDYLDESKEFRYEFFELTEEKSVL